MEQSQFATLCTTMAPMHHRRQGYPFGSLVDFAVDGRGLPVFSLSSLAVHTRNISSQINVIVSWSTGTKWHA